MTNNQSMIPLAKQSKKARQAYYARQRRGWNGLNPATRIVPNGKAYRREKQGKPTPDD